jgi:hypothetical protein
MTTNSSVAGYLTPAPSPAPLQDIALVNFFQEWVVGITGLTNVNVRPRWQHEAPNIPVEGTDWAAIGIIKRETQKYAAEVHKSTSGGFNEIRNHETLHILASFYGDNADNYASLLREGMSLAQNREILFLNNMGLVDWGDVITVPELFKERWLYRVDFDFSIRRQIVRDYSVLNLASGNANLNNSKYQEPINV